MYTAAAVWAMVVAPQQPDSARSREMALFRALNDSLTALQAVSAAFPSDLSSASPELVLVRAERLRKRCAAADSAARPLAPLATVPGAVRRELVTLRAALARCNAQFRARRREQDADSIRAWAPSRLARLGDALRRYRQETKAYQLRLGIK